MLDLENTKRLNQYVSGQVETIKEIHSLMTSDLKRHYTIEELSKQYLMNTTTLKSVFKACLLYTSDAADDYTWV